MVDAVKLLELFSEFAGLAPHFAKRFAYEHPELMGPGDKDAPPSAPAAGADLDSDVEILIEGGKL